MSDTTDRLDTRLDRVSAPIHALAALDESRHLDDDRDAAFGWAIQSDDEAAWASRKAASAQARIAEIQAWRDREIDRIERVADAEAKTPRHDLEFFTGRLGAYLQSKIADGHSKKSLTLPGGKVAIRARKPKIEIDDEDDFVEYLLNLDSSLVRVRESVDKTALAKATTVDGNRVILAATGEVLDGVHALHQTDSVTFTPTEETPA